jgi:hypothetical protein
MKPAISPNNAITDELVALRDALKALTGRVEALLAHDEPVTSRWLSTAEAVEVARIVTTTQSARNWAKNFHLGILVRGRWMIDRKLLLEFLQDRAKDG